MQNILLLSFLTKSFGGIDRKFLQVKNITQSVITAYNHCYNLIIVMKTNVRQACFVRKLTVYMKLAFNLQYKKVMINNAPDIRFDVFLV